MQSKGSSGESGTFQVVYFLKLTKFLMFGCGHHSYFLDSVLL